MLKRVAAFALTLVACASAPPPRPPLPATIESSATKPPTLESTTVKPVPRSLHPLTSTDLSVVRFEPSMDGRVGFHLRATDVSLTIGVPYASFVRTAPETLSLEKCTTEWDSEFALVTNAIVPIESLVLHVGQEEFCRGASYFDFHTRVYLVNMPPEEVLRRVREQGVRAASRLSPKPEGEVKVVPARTVATLPAGLTLNVSRWYGDYGGTASVEVHAVPLAGRTHVIVFLYAHDPAHTADGKPVDPISEILRSIRGPMPSDGRKR
jgi:hypothetical protein